MLNEKNCTCSFKHHLAWRFNEIIGDLDNMLHLARLRRRTKIKRGLFDFVRKISKNKLFGTLADTDASYYNNELDKLYADQKNIVQYVKNQTRI